MRENEIIQRINKGFIHNPTNLVEDPYTQDNGEKSSVVINFKTHRIMKIKILIIICCCFLVSCMEDEDRDQFGFTFWVSNKSGIEHENVKITIGGMENGEFTGTDSYIFPKILVLSNDWPDTTGNQTQYFAFYEERWNPDLRRIKAISDKAYFTVQLIGENPILLYDNYSTGQNELTSFDIPENNIVKNDFGDIHITFETDNIFGDLIYFN